MPQRAIDSKNIIDVDWVKQSFMMDKSCISDEDKGYRIFTTASYKFADTSIGGNAAINPPPQFTRYSDVRNPGVAPGKGTDNMYHGMGRYYSESIDDNAVHAIMRFGVPEFNSLTSFFSNFYSSEAAAMARTGRASSVFFKAGKILGLIVGIVPHALIFAGNVLRWFMKRPPSKYYYLKPTMFPYWNAVTTMVNTIAVNMGVFPPVLVGPGNSNNVNDPPTTNDNSNTSIQKLNAYMHQMLPDIFSDGGKDHVSGGIDVYAISTKYQRLFQQHRTSGYAALANDASLTPSDVDKATMTSAALQKAFKKFSENILINKTPNYPTLSAYGDAYINAATSKWNGASDNSLGDTSTVTASELGGDSTAQVAAPPPADQAASPEINTGSTSSTESIYLTTDKDATPFEAWLGESAKMLENELTDGGAFVSFRVDGSGTIGESFSNSSKESEIQSKINSMSSSSAETRFSLEDGNIGGGIVGKTVEGVISAAKDVLSGIASGVGLEGLAVLAGNAFVDIPKEWDSSVANLPRADFTVQLRSPYGNKLSRLLNLYIPLCMLLGGALPLATGKKSYTSPFLCEIYVRGRLTTRLGMIDSLSITRGAGNIGWTDEGEPLGIDVTFSVVDLSSVMYMPISASFTALEAATQAVAQSVGSAIDGQAGAKLGAAAAASLDKGTWDDDNAYTDYMAVLGSLTMVDQVSTYREWKIRVSQQAAKFNAWKSPGHFASWINSTWPFRIISGFVPMQQRGNTGT